MQFQHGLSLQLLGDNDSMGGADWGRTCGKGDVFLEILWDAAERKPWGIVMILQTTYCDKILVADLNL